MLSPPELAIVGLSLKVSIVAIAAMLPIAFGLAWLLARTQFWGKLLLDAVVHLPLVLPPVVTGWLLLLCFGNNGPAGRFLDQTLGLTLMFRWTGAALAAAIMALPLMVRAIRLSLESIDRRLEDASATLGASRMWVFLTVTLPLALPGIIAGAVLCFAKALGEFGATITFVSNIPGETQTIAAAIYTLTQIPNSDAPILRLMIVSIVISFAALIVSGMSPLAANITSTVALFPAQITSGYAGRKLVSGAGGLPFWALFVLSIAGGAAEVRHFASIPLFSPHWRHERHRCASSKLFRAHFPCLRRRAGLRSFGFDNTLEQRRVGDIQALVHPQTFQPLVFELRICGIQ